VDFSHFHFHLPGLRQAHAKLDRERDKREVEKTRGRGYYAKDLEMISTLGAAAGYLSGRVSRVVCDRYS
jgi:hypothetical protein